MEYYTYLQGVSFLAVLFKLTLSAIAGAIVGYDRTMKRRPAGIKTHALLCLGSALVMVTSQYIAITYGISEISRIPAQVISGIGFLGAGTILVTKTSQIKGLTTAAGLWYSACLGLAIGIGFYSGAIISLFLLLVIVKFIDRIDHYFYNNSKYIEYRLETTNEFHMSTFIQYMKKNECEIISFEDVEDVEKGEYQLILYSTKKRTHSELIEVIRKADYIRSVIEIVNL